MCVEMRSISVPFRNTHAGNDRVALITGAGGVLGAMCASWCRLRSAGPRAPQQQWLLSRSGRAAQVPAPAPADGYTGSFAQIVLARCDICAAAEVAAVMRAAAHQFDVLLHAGA